MDIGENIKLAFRSIKANKLRTILTVLIIAFGIMALVGILTAIDSIENNISNKFSSMGANTFNIRNYGMGAIGGGHKRKVYPKIKYNEAIAFKDRYDFPSKVAVSTRPTGIATIKYKSFKTNPNVTVFGVDENYLPVTGKEIGSGRNFSVQEILSGTNVAILGSDVVRSIFGSSTHPIDKTITVGGTRYFVIGVLSEKGSSIVSSDNIVLIPLNSARKVYGAKAGTYIISVLLRTAEVLDPAIEEATALFRIIRRLPILADKNFEIVRSDKLATTVIDQLKYVALGTTMIGIITLIGAAVGLMNIMLVSVTERTREIGISKAIGANSNMIMIQFLTEAILICQIGGFLGILLGMAAGNAVSVIMEGPFVIPWIWIITGFIFCFVVGLVAGIYPAYKASRLDPIEALRYE